MDEDKVKALQEKAKELRKLNEQFRSKASDSPARRKIRFGHLKKAREKLLIKVFFPIYVLSVCLILYAGYGAYSGRLVFARRYIRYAFEGNNAYLLAGFYCSVALFLLGSFLLTIKVKGHAKLINNVSNCFLVLGIALFICATPEKF